MSAVDSSAISYLVAVAVEFEPFHWSWPPQRFSRYPVCLLLAEIRCTLVITRLTCHRCDKVTIFLLEPEEPEAPLSDLTRGVPGCLLVLVVHGWCPSRRHNR